VPYSAMKGRTVPCSVVYCCVVYCSVGKGREGQRSMGNSVDPTDPCTVVHLNIDPTTVQAYHHWHCCLLHTSTPCTHYNTNSSNIPPEYDRYMYPSRARISVQIRSKVSHQRGISSNSVCSCLYKVRKRVLSVLWL
jgi:hypothetical protein